MLYYFLIVYVILFIRGYCCLFIVEFLVVSFGRGGWFLFFLIIVFVCLSIRDFGLFGFGKLFFEFFFDNVFVGFFFDDLILIIIVLRLKICDLEVSFVLFLFFFFIVCILFNILVFRG